MQVHILIAMPETHVLPEQHLRNVGNSKVYVNFSSSLLHRAQSNCEASISTTAGYGGVAGG